MSISHQERSDIIAAAAEAAEARVFARLREEMRKIAAEMIFAAPPQAEQAKPEPDCCPTCGRKPGDWTDPIDSHAKPPEQPAASEGQRIAETMGFCVPESSFNQFRTIIAAAIDAALRKQMEQVEEVVRTTYGNEMLARIRAAASEGNK